MSIDIREYQQYPIFGAMIELNDALVKRNAGPITLNAVGGFALMVTGTRDKNELTDVDYVGEDLPELVAKVSDRIGIKYGLGKSWINNDIMLAGMDMEDFELATGKLHFLEAFCLEKISVNVLIPEDLLRLKVIAVDTALSAIGNGEDFTRMKDFKDIMKLADKLGLSMEDVEEKYSEYTINTQTMDALKIYKELGMQGVQQMVDRIQLEYQKAKVEKNNYVTSSFIESVLKQARDRLNSER